MIIDEDGQILYDIFKVMSPGELLWCKLKRGTYYFESRYEKDVTYEVIFPLEIDEEDYQCLEYYYLEGD
jgi:hypothetical protein